MNVFNVLGRWYALMRVSGITGGFVGTGATHLEALENAFNSYYKNVCTQ